MNVLIISHKSNVKIYSKIIKSAPNAKVLGAVTSLSSKFIKEVREKWQPHIILADTSIPSPLPDIIAEIHKNYPYIKIIVLTDETDTSRFDADYVVRGNISDIEFKELLKRTFNSIENNTQSPEQSDLNCNVDNLSALSDIEATEKPINSERFPAASFMVKQQKKLRFKISVFAISAICICAAVIIIIVLISFYNKNKAPVSTNDEIEQVSNVYTVAETEEITKQELTELPSANMPPTMQEEEEETEPKTDPPASADITEPPTAGAAISTESSSSNADKKTNDKNLASTENGSTVSKANNNNSTSSSNTNSGSSNSASVSYGGNVYINSGGSQISSIKLSYNRKTMFIGDSLTLKETVIPSDIQYNITWETSNNAVVSVNSDGKVTAISEGSAVVTANADGKKAACSITVIKER